MFLDFNACRFHPCENNAQCEDKINGYICKCISGFGGPNCQERKFYLIYF